MTRQQFAHVLRVVGSYTEDELPPEATGSMEVDTAFLADPGEGWKDRLVTYETQQTRPGRGLCLEPHDCVVAKLVRFDEKDQNFAVALVNAGLINLDILDERARSISAHPLIVERILNWINAMRRIET